MISTSWSKHLSTCISCNSLFQFEQDNPLLTKTQNQQVIHLQKKKKDFYSIIDLKRESPTKDVIVEAFFNSMHHSVFGGYSLSVQISVLKGSV